MPAAWSLHTYSIEGLRSLLSKASTAPWPNDCVHDRYFEDYFAAIGARRVLVEHDYIDHDFLEDFAAYYGAVLQGLRAEVHAAPLLQERRRRSRLSVRASEERLQGARATSKRIPRLPRR